MVVVYCISSITKITHKQVSRENATASAHTHTHKQTNGQHENITLRATSTGRLEGTKINNTKVSTTRKSNTSQTLRCCTFLTTKAEADSVVAINTSERSNGRCLLKQPTFLLFGGRLRLAAPRGLLFIKKI